MNWFLLVSALLTNIWKSRCSTSDILKCQSIGLHSYDSYLFFLKLQDLEKLSHSYICLAYLMRWYLTGTFLYMSVFPETSSVNSKAVELDPIVGPILWF